MENAEQFGNIFKTFTHYGFRKTSMSDLAEAAGVSRQTLYNRFKTKEAILEWAAEGLIAHAKDLALAELVDPQRDAKEALLHTFARWVGDHVELLHNAPHGFEMMDLVGAILEKKNIAPHIEFEHQLRAYLMDKKICTGEKLADDMVFLLTASSKGLMIKSSTASAFEAGMKRVINVLIS